MPAELEKFIRIILNNFLKYEGWKHSLSLYLIGGFARGEGGFELEGKELKVYNDLDFLAIVKRKDLKTLRVFHQLISHLNEVFDFNIDIILLDEAELHDPDPTILNYDIQKNHQWLWGEKTLEANAMKKIDSKDIRHSDVLQLLLNRQASLLIGLMMSNQPEYPHSYVQVQIGKPISAMLIALQSIEGAYTPSYKEQLQWVRDRLEKGPQGSLWQAVSEPTFKDLLNEYEKFKREPQSQHFTPFKESLERVSEIYMKFLRAFMIQLYDLNDSAPSKEIIKQFSDRQPKQWDVLSLNWWITRYRAPQHHVQLRLRPHDHLHVETYVSHVLWLEQFVIRNQQIKDQSQQSAWRDYISWYNHSSTNDDLQRMIDAWKVSGYGCKLQ